MLYFVYRNPLLETEPNNKFPDALDSGFVLNLGRPLPNSSGIIWYLAAREDDDKNAISALPYQTKVIGVAVDNDIEYVAPWLRDWKYKKLGSAADAATKTAIELVPDFERATWESQEREARAYIADAAADTPTLTLMAAQRGDTVADLATKVIAAADSYRALAATNLGKLQSLGAQVYSLPLVDVMVLAWT